MCPIKWQKHYDLNGHSTLLSTRALLLVLENIKTSIEVNNKPPGNNKANRAESKSMMELTDSWIPKKTQKGLVHWTEKHCSLCKKYWDVHTMHNTCNCIGTTPAGHPRSPVAWLGLVRETATHRVQTSCRLFARSARKLSALPSKRLHKVRNVVIVVTEVTVTLTLISEVLSLIAQGKYVFVRK
jgi:hypothetical protein